MKIKQVWVPYHEWEEWKSGMWRKLAKKDEQGFLSIAFEFTGDHIRYGDAMRRVAFEWPRTILNTLTNPSINQKAFLGQFACQYALEIPEYITRQAWGMLTDKQRFDADAEAQKTIDSWKIWHYNKRQLKLEFPDYA